MQKRAEQAAELEQILTHAGLEQHAIVEGAGASMLIALDVGPGNLFVPVDGVDEVVMCVPHDL